jgi:hypothetical protein
MLMGVNASLGHYIGVRNIRLACTDVNHKARGPKDGIVAGARFAAECSSKAEKRCSKLSTDGVHQDINVLLYNTLGCMCPTRVSFYAVLIHSFGLMKS